jgi:hypothetical protein
MTIVRKHSHMYDSLERLIDKYEARDVFCTVMCTPGLLQEDNRFMEMMLYKDAEHTVVKYNMLADTTSARRVVHTALTMSRESKEFRGLSRRLFELMKNDYGWIECTDIRDPDEYNPRYDKSYMIKLDEFTPIHADDGTIAYIDNRYPSNLRCEYHVYEISGIRARLYNEDRSFECKSVFTSLTEDRISLIPWNMQMIRTNSNDAQCTNL